MNGALLLLIGIAFYAAVYRFYGGFIERRVVQPKDDAKTPAHTRYDGTDFCGWQRQPELRAIQGVIEQAARRVLRHQVEVIGSGRTDAGVHAAGQVANFQTTTEIPVPNLRQAIGAHLPCASITSTRTRSGCASEAGKGRVPSAPSRRGRCRPSSAAPWPRRPCRTGPP